MIPEELNAIERRLGQKTTGDVADDTERLIETIRSQQNELKEAYEELLMYQRHVYQGIPPENLRRFYRDVDRELTRAMERYPRLNSAHEAYAIILEELEELWQEIKVKQAHHNRTAMRKEAVQVAAMLTRFVIDVLEAPHDHA